MSSSSEPTSEPISKYWVKIECKREEHSSGILSLIFDAPLSHKEYNINDAILLNNVSIDFIKGAFYASQFNNNYINSIVVSSNLLLNYNCIRSNILLERFCSYDEFEKFHGLNINNNDERIDNALSNRKKILNNPEICNHQWKKFIEEHPGVFEKNPTKQFIAFINVTCPHKMTLNGMQFPENYIVQFDSVDFLNGFEQVRLWTNSCGASCTLRKLHITYVLHLGKVCKTFVRYQNTQKEKDELLCVFEHMNKYLPKELAQLILNMITLCNGHIDAYNNNNNNNVFNEYAEYDECETKCLNDNCHVHQKIRENTIKLADCTAQIKLQQL